MSPGGALTNSEVALLGLLSEKAKHAWQIERDVEHRAMRSWTDLSQSTIYRQLASLHKAGLVDSTQEVVDGRARKVYSLTGAGRDALRARILSLLAEPESPTWGIDLATYNLDLAPREDVLAALARHRDRLRDGIRCFEATEEYMRSCSCPSHRLAVVRRPRYLLKGEIRWIDDFVAELEAADRA
jgi:DNA-binding PadR family transcriptional regulator